jgi:hypothetical protein
VLPLAAASLLVAELAPVAVVAAAAEVLAVPVALGELAVLSVPVVVVVEAVPLAA